jgi:hypothetical protein
MTIDYILTLNEKKELLPFNTPLFTIEPKKQIYINEMWSRNS